MLGALCGRLPKPCPISPHTFSLHLLHSHPQSPLTFHSVTSGACIWRLSALDDWRSDHLRPALALPLGEGSWNVASDARPARWLHRLDLPFLLFAISSSSSFRVTGVQADGRCLFRAIAHGACLQSGKEAPDENRQRELADELRAQVVDELLKRRKDVEWFIGEDFDTYVKRIQQPYVWGGEPELAMASHVLKKTITVFMKDRSTSGLKNIANYGEEYKNDDEPPINVLFHGYGHYDILETCST
ncbi:hypothetical protein RND81_12G241400 [Saponaria officinalis]|uniref:Ubiquitin thioesterase OTU n=1 Tax=Saponaria officinalis TaxID=3572 RepID=A0AAW1HEX6_SAPOF